MYLIFHMSKLTVRICLVLIIIMTVLLYAACTAKQVWFLQGIYRESTADRSAALVLLSSAKMPCWEALEASLALHLPEIGFESSSDPAPAVRSAAAKAMSTLIFLNQQDVPGKRLEGFRCSANCVMKAFQPAPCKVSGFFRSLSSHCLSRDWGMCLPQAVQRKLEEL